MFDVRNCNPDLLEDAERIYRFVVFTIVKI
jgi:hypothetical protein